MKRMTKLAAAAVVMMTAAAGAFAIPVPKFQMSAGVGALFGGNWTKSNAANGICNLNGPSFNPASPYMPALPNPMGGPDIPAGTYQGTVNADSYATKTKRFVGGAYAFFDATFAEFAVAYEGQKGKVTNIKIGTTTNATSASVPYSSYPIVNRKATQNAPNQNITSHQIVLDLLGKYPFTLNDRFTLYPALGLSLRLPFAGNAQSEHAQKQAIGLGLKVGAGLDTNITQKIYLRTEVLYDYEIAADRNIHVKRLNNAAYKVTSSAKDNYNMGVQLRVGVGYRF
jgi:opacity protein-like surface antigen